MSGTVVNLSMDENESQNFFTNLTNTMSNENDKQQQQHTEKEIVLNEIEIILNEKEIEHNNKTNEMLERLNSNQKTIGHNRFQQKIEELEKEIEKNKKYQLEQDMKVNLFKKTISTLQTQLQQRFNLERPLDNNIQLIEEQSEKIKKLTFEISNLKLEKESLNNNLNTHLLTINRLNNENTSIVKKYDILKNEYEELNKTCSEQVYKLENEVSNKIDLQNKLNFELSLKENLESELLILKSQSKTIELENVILDKNSIIQTLKAQLIEMETNVYSKTEKEVDKIIKPTIIGKARGLTNKTRGLTNKR